MVFESSTFTFKCNSFWVSSYKSVELHPGFSVMTTYSELCHSLCAHILVSTESDELYVELLKKLNGVTLVNKIT